MNRALIVENSKTEQSALKQTISVNKKRYKFFLEYLFGLYAQSSSDAVLHIQPKALGLSRQSIIKYRNQALKDGVINVKIIGTFFDKDTGTTFFTTYSVKNHKSVGYTLNLSKYKEVMDDLLYVKSDWATNHRYEAYERYLKEKRNQKILKNLKNFKEGSENYERARLDAHLYTKKIAYNPDKIIEVLNFKYPFVKDYQKIVAELNKELPDELKNRLEFKVKPTASGKYAKSTSIRITNKSCSNISKEKALAKLHDKQYNRKTKEETLNKYSLIDNPHCDTRSSILRIAESLRVGEWLDERYDCYTTIVERVLNQNPAFAELSEEKKTQMISKARETFKPLTLSLFFAGSYAIACRNIDRVIAEKSSMYDKYCSFFTSTLVVSSLDECDFIEENGIEVLTNFMKDVAKEFYLFLGSVVDESGHIKGYSLSNEVFLWESILSIELMRKLMDRFKNDEVKPIIFCQYDCIYINKKVDDFLELRAQIFKETILPLYQKHNCFDLEKAQTKAYEESVKSLMFLPVLLV